MEDINALKASVRASIRERRRLIGEDELMRRDEALLTAFKDALISDERLNRAFSLSDAVAVYQAAGGELPCDALASYIRASGKKTVYPRVSGDDMCFCDVTDPPSELVPGAFGIMAPAFSAESFERDDIGIVIVPGITFDKKGRRLGQGRGYYDRWISGFGEGVRPLLVGVCMDFQMMEEVPSQAFDISMDMVLCI